MKRTKYTKPNISNQIFSIKPTKLNPSNQFYQTKSRETKSTAKSNPSLSEAWPSSAPAYFLYLEMFED